MIYLVDWDSVRLTDRMFDVAHLLSHYIPEARWEEWLIYYGYKYNEKVLENSTGTVSIATFAKSQSIMRITI